MSAHFKVDNSTYKGPLHEWSDYTNFQLNLFKSAKTCPNVIAKTTSS